MDIKTLESLGLNLETLGDRIVDQCVSVILHGTSFDPDTEEPVCYDTKFKNEIRKRIQDAVDAKIAAVAGEHILPKVGELIEHAEFREHSRYGEPTGPALTFKEYIAARAGKYMSENVNYEGRSKEEATEYSWKAEGPRLTVLMRLHIRETLEKHTKIAMSDVNKSIAKNIESAARDAITAAAAAIKVSISA